MPGSGRRREFVKELYAAGEIDADRLDTGVAGVLAARSEAEVADVVRSLPAPVALTSPERRLARPLEIHSGLGRLRLAGRWQVAAETHISADLGSIRLDLTEAEFDDHVIDLHVYTGWGSITIIVPPGVAVQVIRHRGGVDSRLDPPAPGLPLVRLDVTTNIGRVHLRHPGTLNRTRRWPGTSTNSPHGQECAGTVLGVCGASQSGAGLPQVVQMMPASSGAGWWSIIRCRAPVGTAAVTCRSAGSG